MPSWAYLRPLLFGYSLASDFMPHLIQNLTIASAYGTLSTAALWACKAWGIKGRAARWGGFYLPFAFIGSCGVGHALVAIDAMKVAHWWHWSTAIVSWGMVAAFLRYRHLLGAQFAASRETEAILAYVASDPWGVWEVTNNVNGEPDLLCLRQNTAAAEQTGGMVGRLLGEAMPSHRLKQGYNSEPLLDTYLSVAGGDRDSYRAEIFYSGPTADGRTLANWFRQRVVNVGPGRVFITWTDITAERDEAEATTALLEVQRALLTRQFKMVYQPIYRLEDMQLAGYEALIRWPHPDGTTRPPIDFLPLLDRAGLSAEVFYFSLEAALEELQRLPEHLRIAINLSPEVAAADSFPAQMERLCDRYSVARQRVMLEITEGQALEAPVIPKLKEARADGHRVAIDDFGAGYASYSLLLNSPFDALKLDRSLGERVDREYRRGELAKGVLALADVLGLETVAEGLETDGEVEWFRQAGCRYGQGFALGMPGDIAAAGDWPK